MEIFINVNNLSKSVNALICRLFLYYCIVSIHLYSASCSAHKSEALPVREAHLCCLL